MKLSILVIMISLLSGCATMGTLMQGAGQGMMSANNDNQVCTTYNYGNYSRVICR